MAFQLCQRQLQIEHAFFLPFSAVDSEEGPLHERWRELQAKAMKVREKALHQGLFKGIFSNVDADDALISLGLWATVDAIFQQLIATKGNGAQVESMLELYKGFFALLVENFSGDAKNVWEPYLEKKKTFRKHFPDTFGDVPFDIDLCATPKVQTLVKYLLEKEANNPEFKATVLVTHPKHIDALACALDYCVPGKTPLRARWRLGKSKNSKKIPVRWQPWWNTDLKPNVTLTMHIKGAESATPAGVVVAFDEFQNAKDMYSVSKATAVLGGTLVIMGSSPRPRYLAWMGSAGWTGAVVGPINMAVLAAEKETRTLFNCPILTWQPYGARDDLAFELLTPNKAILTDATARTYLTQYLQTFANYNKDWNFDLPFERKLESVWRFEQVNLSNRQNYATTPYKSTALIPIRKKISWPRWSQSRKALLDEMDLVLLDKFAVNEDSDQSYSVLKVNYVGSSEIICKQKTAKVACLWLYVAGELDDNLVSTIKSFHRWNIEEPDWPSYKRARLL